MRSIEALKSGMIIGVGFLSVVSVAYAAISWPATPSGETVGGKYSERLTPSGAVMAFYLSSCPTGWKAADGTNSTPDLRWTFIRGFNGSWNGRDAPRTLGDYQTDAFQGHWHTLNTNTANNGMADNYANNPLWGWNGSVATATVGYWVTHPISDTANGTPRTTNETRPKNVALLYCVKN